jgi:hypothetical protein
MGPGCPAGVLLDQPQRPAARNGVPAVDLRRVQLVAQANPEPEGGLLAAVLLAAAKGAVVAFALVGVAFTVAVVIEVADAAAKPANTVKVTT